LSIFFATPFALRAANPASAAVPLESLLRDLKQLGIDVIFSSELVPPDLLAPAPSAAGTPLQRANEALAAHGLALRPLAPNRYVVVRASPSPTTAPANSDTDIEEVSVYASRYSIEGRIIAEPHNLAATDIERVPGSHDDALRAMKSLPGLASNLSGKPYIRGSLADDVLVRYDGITLLDPYHLKNFQSLISAIDPAAVDRIDVFSGGFPVRYGTRSGGVIDISAPSRDSGYENRAAVSLVSAGVSSVGHAENLPVDWLVAIRHSTIDLLDPVEDDFGEPRFSDSLGRLRWHTDNGAWTLGWLLLDDQIELRRDDDAETANARYRDEYIWLARDLDINEELHTHVTAVLTSANRLRDGTLDQPGVATGTLDANTEYDRVELNNLWSWQPGTGISWIFGAEAAVAEAQYEYSRAASYDPVVAAAFDRAPVNDLDFNVDPKEFTYALHAAAHRRWTSFEAELGLRFDGEHYNLGGDHTQLSPRLNLRYDFNQQLRAYASIGRFTQAQPVEEWRVESAQSTADPAQVSTHSIFGLTYEPSPDTRWGLEFYNKRWTTVAPYFDNILDPLALTPDLSPDRIRIDPRASEADGLELNLRHAISAQLSTSGTLSWARVADDMGPSDVLRSWDQPLAMTVGVAWQLTRLSLSGFAGWHRGWPRTPVAIDAPSDDSPGELLLGARNSERWGSFFSLDLRGSFTWQLATGDFSTVVEVTNATDRRNECCTALATADDGVFLESDTRHWLPFILNIGFSYRWRGPH
jgi:outer membrane receptor protein involved in Fe transport